MSEKETKSEKNFGELRVKEPDNDLVASTGLPGDLLTSAISVHSAISRYEYNDITEAELREQIAKARTFEEYYKDYINRVNSEPENKESPFDQEASYQRQLEIVTNKEAIRKFDEKIMQLRNFSNAKVLNPKEIKQFIMAEIVPIIRGR